MWKTPGAFSDPAQFVDKCLSNEMDSFKGRPQHPSIFLHKPELNVLNSLLKVTKWILSFIFCNVCILQASQDRRVKVNDVYFT